MPDSPNNTLELLFQPLARLSDSQISELVQNEMDKFEFRPVPGYSNIGDPLDRLASSARQNSAIRHNEAVKKYRQEFKEFLIATSNYLENDNRTFEIVTEVQNNGTAVAEDIDVVFSGPEDIVFLEEQLTIPSAPEPPLTEQNLVSGLGMPNDAEIYRRLQPYLPGNVGRFGVSDDGGVIQANVGKVKHHTSERLKSFWIQFVNESSVKPLAIEYKMLCKTLPSPVVGKIHIVPRTQE